jgi:hypothetical protein
MMSDNQELTETEPIPDDLLEIRGSESDQQQLMERVADRVEQRRDDAGTSTVRFPSYKGVPYPGTPEYSRYDPDLYHNLRLANSIYPDVMTEPELEPSPATRIPIVGDLWRLVRAQAHNLVLFYVNRSTRHEVDVNRHIVSVLNSLAISNQEQLEIIDDLKAEVDELRSKSPRSLGDG